MPAQWSGRAAIRSASTARRSKLGRTYPLRIGGQKLVNDRKINSIMPASPKTVVGAVSKATREQAQEAIAAAQAVGILSALLLLLSIAAAFFAPST